MNTEKYKERFMSKVYPEPNTGCWLWSGKINQDGYGRLHWKNLNNSHRISYYIHKGDFDFKLNILHHCDNPCCVNPDHLYAGTQAQNVIDRDSRKRRIAPKGSLSGRAKINESTAEEIKRLRNDGLKIKDISKLLQVSISCVSDISSGRSWK